MNGPAALLDVRHLRKRFGGLQVLDDVSLRIAPGETVAIVGPNGSGKTTTLDLIAGALQADGGSIELNGRSIGKLPVSQRAERGIARTFQNGRVFGNLTVGENVLAGAFVRRDAQRPFARLRGLPILGWLPLLAELGLALLPPPRARRAARRLDCEARTELDRFGSRLLPRVDERAYLFSYANRRRIEIARALIARPALLLLDEPAAGMNSAETRELQTQLARLRTGGQTMLLVEHKLELVRALADRVIVLDGGRKIFDGSPLDFQTDPAVVEAYVGRSADIRGAVAARPALELRPLLELRAIDVSYGTFKALAGVSLSVRSGEIVSLLGANASGKSTTMKVVLGLVAPTSGHVTIDDRDATRLPTAARIRSGIASVPEARRIFPTLTVEENLRVGAFVRRARVSADDLTRVFDLFPRLGERRGQLGGTLSGGEQQMLAIGRALMSRPRLLCLDEPTMGLSPLFVERVLEALVAINATGTSILMVEQNVELALRIAHRGYVLAGGAIVASGSGAELHADPAIREAFLGSSASG